MDTLTPYTYDLPEERIAQRPVKPADQSKLLLVDRSTGAIGESRFANLAQFLKPTDLLVFNNTQVRPCRLFGNSAGGGRVELFLLKELADNNWLALARPKKRFKLGRVIEFPEGLRAEAVEFGGVDGATSAQLGRLGESGEQLQVRLWSCYSELTVAEAISRVACMPIPPYIRGGAGDKQDLEDYQTIFAENIGSVAAPTASLHFTPALVESLRLHGVKSEFLTLHVGPPSFLPVFRKDGGSSPDELSDREKGTELTFLPPGAEEYLFDPELIQRLVAHREAGGRVIAVGTTVVRALESSWLLLTKKEGGAPMPKRGFMETSLCITPGFKFGLVDGLITNFHQPGSSHLLLVESFLGRELLDRGYTFALNSDFRFLSYGDGSLII